MYSVILSCLLASLSVRFTSDMRTLSFATPVLVD